MIRIEGILSNIHSKFLQKAFTQAKSEHSEFYFVSRPNDPYPVGQDFTFIDSQGKRFTVFLVEVSNQVADKLTGIPRGWNTICLLTFIPFIPQEFKDLPVLTDWDYKTKVELIVE